MPSVTNVRFSGKSIGLLALSIAVMLLLVGAVKVFVLGPLANSGVPVLSASAAAANDGGNSSANGSGGGVTVL